MRRFCIIVLIVILAINCSCGPDRIEDYHIIGIENYVDNPEDAVFAEMTNDLEYLLTEFDFCDSIYHYFIKDAEIYSGKTYGPGRYSLSILALTYKEEEYSQVKKYLIENHEYTTETPQYSINGYHFYEENLPWSSFVGNIMFHTFNDDRNTVVLFNFAASSSCVKDFAEERENDFAGMLEKYFGQFYDFNETDEGAEEKKQEQASGSGVNVGGTIFSDNSHGWLSNAMKVTYLSKGLLRGRWII